MSMSGDVNTGVWTGAAIGGAGGLLAAAGLFAVPGIGPILALGPLAAGLTGAAAGGVTAWRQVASGSTRRAASSGMPSGTPKSWLRWARKKGLQVPPVPRQLPMSIPGSRGPAVKFSQCS